MGRTYKRHTDRQSWSETAMSNAIAAVNAGHMGTLKAAKQFGVPRTTVQRLAKQSNGPVLVKKHLGSKIPVFPESMERELVDHIKALDERYFGFSTAELRKVAYQFAERNNIPHPFNDQKQEAGKDWLSTFLSRYPELSLRTPENTSLARASAFNRVSVNKYFDLLESEVDKHKFTPDRMYNVDETGITTVPNKPSKVISLRGKKQVGSITSAERGQLVTVEICMSAAGHYVPPLFVFPRVRMKAELLDRAPPGSIAVPHKSGWMQTELFVQWFRHFIGHTNPTSASPVLLVLDGHKTHTLNLDVINLARANHVTILCLPPHCTHRLQPLDVGLMKPLMTYYTQEVEKWLRKYPGRVVSLYQVAELFGAAYMRAATMLTAVNAFHKTGLYPVNRHIFNDADFCPSSTTERLMQPTSSQSAAEVQQAQSSVVEVQQAQSSAAEVQQVQSVAEVQQAQSSAEVQQAQSSLLKPLSTPRQAVVCKPRRLVPISIISPLPVCQKETVVGKRRARGETVVLTSSPYKARLQGTKSENKNDCKKTEKRKEDSNVKNVPQPKKRKKAVVRADSSRRPLGLPRAPKNVKKNKPSVDEDADDETECAGCGELYCESSEDWLACVACKSWYEISCAGMLGKPKRQQDSFHCPQCE